MCPWLFGVHGREIMFEVICVKYDYDLLVTERKKYIELCLLKAGWVG